MSTNSAMSALKSALRSARNAAAMVVYKSRGVGVKPDSEVAKTLGTSKANIQHIRWAYNLGTPPAAKVVKTTGRGRIFSKEMLMKLLRVGKTEAVRIKAILGINKRAPHYQLIDWTKPNQQIAMEERLTLGTVTVMRSQAKKAGLKVPRSSTRHALVIAG